MPENIKELHYLQFKEGGDKYTVAPGGYGLGNQYGKTINI